MFKCIIGSLLFILSISTLSAQTVKGTLSGTIKIKGGEPVEFASVMLKSTHYGTTTNKKGVFILEAPAGEYIMIIHSFLLKAQEIPVMVLPNNQNNLPVIIVEEKAIDLNEVVITGQHSPQSLQNSIYKVRVINAQEIEQKGASNVQTLLNTEVGVRMSNDMALGETDFEIMGMGGNNVKVLIDGVPVIDRLDKKQSLNQIDINSIERIEIVEGPMSVMYGTDALAGVINVITKKGKQDTVKRFSIGAKVQEETLGNEYNPFYDKGQHIQNVNTFYTFKNGLFGSASITHNGFGGWQGDLSGRKKEWPSKDQYLGGVQLGIDKKNYGISYRLDYMNEHILRKGDVPLNKKVLDEEFLADRFTHQIQGNWKMNKHLQFVLAGSYQDYRRDKRSTMKNLASGEESLSKEEGSQDETEYSVWFGRLTTTWYALKNLSIQTGIEYQRNKGDGDKITEGNNIITNAAFFTSVEYSPVKWLHIRPGVRSSYNSKYNAPLAIPSINIKTKLNKKMDIRLSYARGFRAPTLQELYYTFYHVNGGGFWIKGNPDLEAEKSDSYMGSYIWRIIANEEIRFTSTLSGFYNDFKDRIQMVQSATESSTQTYYNTGKYKTIGLTFENTLVWKAIRAAINVSYIGRYNTLFDNEDYIDEKQDNMRYSPELSTSITYDWKKVATFNLFYKFTGARHEYKVYDDQLMLGGLNSYHWADITVSRPINKHLNISVGVKNIFDVTRVDNTISNNTGGNGTSSVNSSLLGCGRSYFIGLTFNFNK